MEELKLISNPEIAKATSEILEKAPKKFWILPASLSGKYHPEDERKEGGLIKHTKKVIKIASYLCNIYEINSINKDLIIAACIIHDILKYGDDSIDTYSDIGKTAFKKHGAALIDFAKQFQPDGWHQKILEIASRHNGKWELQPRNDLEMIVHIADYLASRTDIEVKLNEINS